MEYDASVARRITRILPLLVAVLTIIAFLPSLHNGFVTWDDNRNFLDNYHYRGLGPAQLGWMWTTFHMGHYVPLSWMTLGLDYVVWGMNATGYHLTSLLIHAANAVVLYFIARRLLRLAMPAALARDSLTLALAAAFAALLFAVHPLRVESVAWVTERRDVLSGFFSLSTLLLYLRSLESAAESTTRVRRDYWLALFVFVCALLSKATAMTIPAVLLILNVYPLRRVSLHGWWGRSARGVYLEITPFALLSAATAVLSIVALHPPSQLTMGGKLAVSAYSLAFYVWKTIIPTNLAPLYEMPRSIHPTEARFIASYVVVIALCGAAWAVRRRWPGITTAWLAFFVTVLPLLGIVQNGPQIAADRYTYHATPALAILAGAGFLVAWPHMARAVAGIAVALLATLGSLTWIQTGVWHDPERLWSHVLRLDPESSIGNTALAQLVFKQDKVEEAIKLYTRALASDPDYAEGHNNLGVALAHQGRFADAVTEYQRALALKPAYDDAHNNWGAVLAHQGDVTGALEQYRQAIALNPDNADAQVNWGNALVRLGKPNEAIQHYRDALRIRPDHADAHHNWGVALARQGKLSEAIEQFRQALAINPSHAEAKEYLERALQLQQQAPRR
jgi:Tfp pilus assembly protein PilF